jgi:hypothetical protein
MNFLVIFLFFLCHSIMHPRLDFIAAATAWPAALKRYNIVGKRRLGRTVSVLSVTLEVT